MRVEEGRLFHHLESSCDPDIFNNSGNHAKILASKGEVPSINQSEKANCASLSVFYPLSDFTPSPMLHQADSQQ